MSRSSISIILAVLSAAAVAGCRTTAATDESAAPVVVGPPIPLNDAEDRGYGGEMSALREVLRDRLGEPITLKLESVSFQEAVAALSRTSGLGIGILEEPSSNKAGPVSLNVHDMPARYALDWITRQAGVSYTVKRDQSVLITDGSSGLTEEPLEMRDYAVGTFFRSEVPLAGRFRQERGKDIFLSFLKSCLQYSLNKNKDARVLLDETGSRLTAILPPSGHEKLVQILQEIKKPRRYEAPPPDNAAKEQAGLLAQAVTCRFVNQDVRAAAAAIGRQAGVNVGFDYALVDQDHRIVTLDSGETTLGAALDALAKAAGLGETVAEPGRRFWILGPGQTDRVLRTTGELLWDRAVVRSYYILPLQENFGIDMVYEKLFQAVTPGEWNGDVPVARYLISTGRLVVIHDEPSQRRVAACIDNMMGLLKPQRP